MEKNHLQFLERWKGINRLRNRSRHIHRLITVPI